MSSVIQDAQASATEAGAVRTLTHFINGQRVAGTSDRFGDVYDPSTGAVTGRAPYANRADVRSAVESSKAAFPAWADLAPAQRARILFRYRDLLDRHLDELATLLSSEHGKTFDDARGSVTRGMEVRFS